jgi:hypothetical protein
MRTMRVANGQGFWGDSVDAPVQLIQRGGIDYLTMDYLAEVTLSIMQRQKLKDPRSGYARDFVELIERVLPDLLAKNIKLVSNAGGVNAPACSAALKETARRMGHEIRIGTIEGDDILHRLDELMAAGAPLANMETGEPLSTIRDKVTAANVYIDSFCIAEALGQGAQIVLAGRVSDPGLALGPLIHEFGWKRDDWNLLAAGTVAGHITECGAQCSGGNYSRWWEVPDYAGIGYPVVEVSEDGSMVVTKQPGTGGLVNRWSVTEQLVYEMGDPKHYISPDTMVDFTSLALADDGENRVRVSGTRGAPATDSYKVSISYLAGWKASGQLTVCGPRAIEKARLIGKIIWDRLAAAGCVYEDTLTELVGIDSCHPGIAPEPVDPPEVVLRLSCRDTDRNKVDRFGKELAPVITNGPSGITGFAGGRPKAQEIVAFWPALVPKHLISTRVTVE